MSTPIPRPFPPGPHPPGQPGDPNRPVPTTEPTDPGFYNDDPGLTDDGIPESSEEPF